MNCHRILPSHTTVRQKRESEHSSGSLDSLSKMLFSGYTSDLWKISPLFYCFGDCETIWSHCSLGLHQGRALGIVIEKLSGLLERLASSVWRARQSRRAGRASFGHRRNFWGRAEGGIHANFRDMAKIPKKYRQYRNFFQIWN